MAPVTPSTGKPGEVLRRWRYEAGKRQEDLANDAQVSQKLISELERGEQDLMAAGIGRVTNIVRALRKTLQDLQNETGIDLALQSDNDVFLMRANTPQDGEAFTHSLMDEEAPEVTPERMTKSRLRPIPAELQEMIDEKSELVPELADERWQQYLAGQRFSTGRASAERWWNLYLVVKNAGIEPGGN